MATITKTKSGYEVRWDEYDKEGVRHYRKKRFERKFEADDFIVSVLSGKVNRLDQDVSFAEYAESWWAFYKHTLEVTTTRSYRRIIDIAISYFGKKLTAVSPTDIERFYSALKSIRHPLTTKPLSSSSVQRYHAVLRLIFKYAMRDGLIIQNPCDLIDRPKSSTQEIVLPDLDAVKERLLQIKEATPVYYVGVCIAFFLGIRSSEVLGLKWSDIDFDRKTVSIRRVRQRIGKNELGKVELNAHTRLVALPGMGSWIERDRTKSKHNRVFIMPDDLVSILKSARAQQNEDRLRNRPVYVESDYVCTNAHGKPIDDGELTRSMKGVCRLHDLRHLNASHLIDAGLPIPEVSRRLGHTTPTTTQNIYAHAIDKQDENAAKYINERFGFKM